MLAALYRQLAAEAEARGDMRQAEHYFGIAAGWERLAVRAERDERESAIRAAD